MSVDQALPRPVAPIRRVIAMRMKWYETTARYLLGAVYLFGAVDGALFLFFGIYMHGKPPAQYTFLLALQGATYFWAFLKLIQLAGAVSLLYRILCFISGGDPAYPPHDDSQLK